MSTQYDGISGQYKSFKDFPVWDVINPNVLRYVGNVHGLKCLDLACGLGDWSRRLIERGAERVVGIDISPGMIERAQDSLTEAEASKISFHVKDCGKPFTIPDGPYDFIFAGWLLNYAPSHAIQVVMWRNIHNNLKPGGRFVAITPNTWCPMFESFDSRYGVSIELIKPVQDREWRGSYVRNIMHTVPEPSSFETYYWLHDFYESAAAEGGVKELRWHPTLPPNQIPDGSKAKEEGFWDIWMMRPMINILTAKRECI